MIKLDLNDAYFCVPLHKGSREFARFQWYGKLYEFLCLCFSLGHAPRIFIKMLKKFLAVLRRMNMLIIINCLYRQYANNRLNQKGGGVDQGHSHLPPATFRFLFNLKKSVFQPCQEIRFLELIVNSVNLTLSLSLSLTVLTQGAEGLSLTVLTQGAEGPREVHKDVQQ